MFESCKPCRWFAFALIINVTYGLDKQEGISENFITFFPFQQLISLINADFYEDIIYDCSLLDLESSQCESDCQYYNNISALYSYINELIDNGENILNDSLITNISSWYATSSSAFNYYDVGNPLQCEYYYGTYCYTPITVKSDITLYQHGCCIPGSCKGLDAEKVLANNAFCFASFNSTIYNKVYKNNNISILGYELDTNLNIQCSADAHRSFNSIGIYLVFGIFAVFMMLILMASVIRNYIGATPQVNMTELIADNMSEADAFCAYFVSIFAIQDNFNLLLDRRNVITFEYLDGLRVWSFAWILFMASIQIYFIVGLNDIDGILPQSTVKGDYIRSDWDEYVTKSVLSVFAVQFPIDTFFWLSGFLGVLSLHKILKRQNPCADSKSSVSGGCCASICAWFCCCCECKYIGCCKMITFTMNSWIRRYLRLIPMVIYIMLITAYLLDQIPSGYHVIDRNIYNKCCSNTFWSNLLLIRNFFSLINENQCIFGCMSHIWYICSDFQLFLLVPILVYIYDRLHKMLAMIICFSFVIIGIAVRLFLGFYFEFSANVVFETNESVNDGDQILMSFYQPWSRIGAYYLGVLTMFTFMYVDEYYNENSAFSKIDNQIYLKTQNWKQFKLKKYQFMLLQIASIVIISALLGVPYQNTKNQPSNHWNEWQNAIWYALCQPLWCFALSLLIFALKYRPIKHIAKSVGAGGGVAVTCDDDEEPALISTVIITILSGSGYEILSKLTYTMYLIHFFVLRWWSLTLSQPVYFNLFNILNLSIATWIICAVFALILWLVIEKPIFNLIEVIHLWCKNKENVYSFKVENKNKRQKQRRRKKREFLSHSDSANYLSLEMQSSPNQSL